MAVALFIWGFIQSFIVGLIIPMVKRVKANFLLSAIFIITASNILFQYLLRYRELKNTHPNYLIVPDILDLVLPSLVLLYVNYILGKPLLKRRYGYFIIPIIWSVILILYVNLIESFTFETYIGTNFHKLSLSIIFGWKFFLFYKALTLYKKEFKLANSKNISLFLWPKVLVIFMGLIAYIAFVNMIYWFIVGVHHDASGFAQIMQQLTEINYLLFTSSIIFMTIFFAFKYPKILSGAPIVKRVDEAALPDGKKLLKKLNTLIDDEKVHLDTELDEKKLADIMGIQSYLLSKLINDYLGKSFSEFINEKRIEEAQRLLTSKEHKDLTVFAVAIDSGFRSESVFYVNFKKISGCTPNQYKQRKLGAKV
ncbi:AraC family transcriptional regulator [Galbibacter sp. BG1]|uniref:AraC family transcriptional regulator n=1 Tax=Galbibacter sp. BG1 TaxID=1170699 RepID=UPI0015BC1050|nr:helix-turn-helix domain-containing protein [Galbibacter sp. BG1]QLE02202.1 AraC family transcriptional regulator [Galbibacter sp. BG1]